MVWPPGTILLTPRLVNTCRKPWPETTATIATPSLFLRHRGLVHGLAAHDQILAVLVLHIVNLDTMQGALAGGVVDHLARSESVNMHLHGFLVATPQSRVAPGADALAKIFQVQAPALQHELRTIAPLQLAFRGRAHHRAGGWLTQLVRLHRLSSKVSQRTFQDDVQTLASSVYDACLAEDA